MPEFDSIDGWFEGGFRVRRQKPVAASKQAGRDRRRNDAGGSPAPRGAVKFSASAKMRNINSVVRKAPEVMVKITGKSYGLGSVKRHLDYISRNGKVSLTDESGNQLEGRKAVEDYRRQLKAAQIPESTSKREFLHVMFSMPSGTPAQAMRESVAQFCREEYSNRRYVMALHEDTDQTHVHVCVGTRDIYRADEPRLSPRLNDLFRWRQGFAEKLRDVGVDAAASYRQHRFQHQRAEHGVVRQIRADHPELAGFNAKRSQAKTLSSVSKALTSPETAFVGPSRPPRVPRVLQRLAREVSEAVANGQRPENPAGDAVEARRRDTLKRWTDVHQQLQVKGERELANRVARLLADGERPARSRTQELFDGAQQEPGRNEQLL
jgi:hypothetical protein